MGEPPYISRDWPRKNEEGGAWDRAFPCPRGRPGSWAGKVRRRLREGKAGWPALPLESPRLPVETFSRLREVRRGLLRRGAADSGRRSHPGLGRGGAAPWEYSPSWRRPGAAGAGGRKVERALRPG